MAEPATRKLGYIVDAYVGVKLLISAAFERADETAGEETRSRRRGGAETRRHPN